MFGEISTVMDVAPASRPLSISSLTTAQGSGRMEVEPIAWAVEAGSAAIGILLGHSVGFSSPIK